jgi:hypothetical protein
MNNEWTRAMEIATEKFPLKSQAKQREAYAQGYYDGYKRCEEYKRLQMVRCAMEPLIEH